MVDMGWGEDLAYLAVVAACRHIGRGPIMLQSEELSQHHLHPLNNSIVLVVYCHVRARWGSRDHCRQTRTSTEENSDASQPRSPGDEGVVVTPSQQGVCFAPGVAVDLCRRCMVTIVEPSFAIAGTPHERVASQLVSQNAESGSGSNLLQTASGTWKR